MGRARLLSLFLFLLAFALAGCGATEQPVPQPSVVAVLPSATLTGSATAQPTQPTPVATATEPPSGPTEVPAATALVPTVDAAAPTEQPVAQSNCYDMVLFLSDVNFPDFSTLEPGILFRKTWRVQNAGSCAWNENYKLTFLSGEAMTGVTSYTLPAVQPGATVDLSIEMTSPQSAGGYTSNWQFINPAGAVIPLVATDQAYVWLKVNIAAAPSALVDAQPTREVVPVTGPNPQPTAVTSPLPAHIPVACASTFDETFSNRVLALINAERSSRGVPALSANPLLNAAARVQSADMSCNNFVEHYGSDGSTWFTRIKAQGYNYGYAAENVAAGNPAFGGTAEWVVQTQWMNSQVHRDNILNPNVTEIGVAYLYNPAAQWGGYTTVVFAKP